MAIVIPVLLSGNAANRPKVTSMLLGTGFSLLAITGNLFVYLAFRSGGLAALVVPLTNIYPLFTVILAVLFLKERLAWMQWPGIILLLTAIPLLTGQIDISVWLHTGYDSWVLFAFAALLFFTLFSISQKITSGFLPAAWSFLCFVFASALFSVVFLFLGLIDFKYSFYQAVVGILAGLFDGLGVFFVFKAYHNMGKASQVSAIAASMQQVFTLLLALLILGEHISLPALGGIGLAVTGTWLLLEKS